jgi:D-3-phosphoglycerate dehydrogenase
MMKNNVRILNFARGGLVNLKDLKEAITSGKVARYITDFPDKEVLEMEKVIAIPHLAASTKESETNCAVMAVNQVKDFLENGNITNSVNFPAAAMERHDGCRITIANKNIPNMVSQISSILASEHINIDSMLNRKYNGIAYNIIDVTQKTVDASISDKLKAIDGVCMVRILPAI